MQIKNDFAEMQKNLEDLTNEVQTERDAAKKQEKIQKIQRLEKEQAEARDLIDKITDLHEEELLALKSKLDEYKEYKQEILDIRKVTPTTYEILKDSETYDRLINIISSNPNEFKNLPWDTAEKKLEYIFTKIRSSIVLFMKNKLWESSSTEYVINNTIAPAFEWSLLELLTIQWNETNVNMLQWIDNISFKKLGDLINWVWDFSKKMSWSYNKFNQWMNAIDYLSVHNWVLSNPKKSAVLTNPLKFEAYMNNSKFGKAGFSPYAPIEWNIFEISDDENFEFWLSSTEEILKKIWDIKVENNPRTTSLIAKMIDKPEKFLKKTDWLQKTANGLLDGLYSINLTFKTFWIDKILWTDILGEFTKAPEKRSFWYRIVDFVCKLIWITWGLEWIVKKWRLDRMNLTDEKNHDISEIFKRYQKATWENVDLNITDDDSCKAALADFAVTDFDDSPTTKWDYLRDSIIYNMNLSHISPAVVSQAIEQNVLSKSREEYLKEEVVTVKWKQQQKITIIPTWFTSDDIKNLAQNHLKNMKAHLEAYDDNELQDFYTSIKSTEDLALCIATSLYADVDDVVEWVKAKIFLPENYWSVHSDWTVVDNWTSWLSEEEQPSWEVSPYKLSPWEYPFKDVPPYKGIKTYDLRNVKMTPVLDYSELVKKHEWTVTLSWSNITNKWYEYPTNGTAWNKSNNPCDISHSSFDIWYTSSGTVADWQHLAKYNRPIDGIASAMRLLKNKYQNKSVTEIDVWWYQWYYKPNEEIWLSALRIKWITDQCNALWIWPHQMLDFNDPTTLKSFVAQVAVLETGTHIGEKLLDDAYNLAFA